MLLSQQCTCSSGVSDQQSHRPSPKNTINENSYVDHFYISDHKCIMCVWVQGGVYLCHIVNGMLFVCVVGMCVVQGGCQCVGEGWVDDFFYVGVNGQVCHNVNGVLFLCIYRSISILAKWPQRLAIFTSPTSENTNNR